ncbi:hypothetical protein SmJEL517_g00589 [Synchytrium microbalum]|uniref:Signal recognition particle 9 kDa protein n=1 Tax=Synchytrium microbalum TaxID=1806994 RepID=A0A507C7A0_9FUNG|nr:uncharacterized protein SmJEL517_g00589 [Synchytrium microbalum]TPX37450.1 hypothetical protein SmJEL517_g00589 [Synchytrium microbalum]
MVYIEKFEDFEKAVEDLYLQEPNRTRYCTRYRHVDGQLILKVTDDRTCLKFRTNQQPDLRKFERLTKSLMEKMIRRKARPVPEPAVADVVAGSSSSPAKAKGKKKGKK